MIFDFFIDGEYVQLAVLNLRTDEIKLYRIPLDNWNRTCDKLAASGVVLPYIVDAKFVNQLDDRGNFNPELN